MPELKNLKVAVLNLAYDNGAIFRGRSEEYVLSQTMYSLEKEFRQKLFAVESALEKFSEAEQEILVSGEMSEIEKLYKKLNIEEAILVESVLNAAFEYI